MRRTCDQYQWPRRSRLAWWMRKAATPDEFRRRQVILLAAGRMPYPRIAGIVGVSVQAVKLWVSQYRRLGSEGLRRKGRGGRRKGLLTLEQEKTVIGEYMLRSENAPAGKAQLVGRIIFEKCSKRPGRWYIYKLLERHGLRQHRLRGLSQHLEYSPPAEKLLPGTGEPASNMYADAKTWSPFKGCRFGCEYCKTSFQLQAKRQKHNCKECYSFTPHFHPERLSKIPSAKTVFVCGNADISFASHDQMKQIIGAINSYNKKHPSNDKTFYLQSKEPSCLKPFLQHLPGNVIILTTLETNRDKGYDKVSKAPVPSERYRQFLALDYPRKVVTIEPVMDFDLDVFSEWILKIRPEYVWLGLNSRKKPVLPEPGAGKLKALADILVKSGIPVKGKTLRGIKLA